MRTSAKRDFEKEQERNLGNENTNKAKKTFS